MDNFGWAFLQHRSSGHPVGTVKWLNADALIQLKFITTVNSINVQVTKTNNELIMYWNFNNCKIMQIKLEEKSSWI